MEKENIYKMDKWYMKCHDGRKKLFRGISKKDFEEARERHFARVGKHVKIMTAHERRVDFLNYFRDIPTDMEFDGDGLDDYSKYQRPASNGIGYVAICPGERCNNVYVDDKILVYILKKLYNKKLYLKQ